MNQTRYDYLFDNIEAELTQEELDQGWHFCTEWDFLLIGPEMKEMECCNCLRAAE